MLLHQRVFSTEPMAAAFEELYPVDVRSVVLSRLSVGLAVQVPQTETVLQ